MAVRLICRGLEGFGIDERNPRLAPPSQSLQTASRVRINRHLFETSIATDNKTCRSQE